jgi:hypothetical protein
MLPSIESNILSKKEGGRNHEQKVWSTISTVLPGVSVVDFIFRTGLFRWLRQQ